MNNPRTLSGIDSNSLNHLSLPSTTNALSVGSNIGLHGQVLAKNENDNKLEWSFVDEITIPDNSINGNKLALDIGFNTTGNITLHNPATDSATLTADKLVSTRTTLSDTDYGLDVAGNAKIGGDLTITGDLELDDIIMDDLTIKGEIILDTAGTGTGNTRKLDLVASSGDIIQYETFDPPSEYASIRNGAGAFRSLDTSGKIITTEARGGATDLAISALGNVQFGGYMNCRSVQTSFGAAGQFTGNFSRGVDITNPVGGSTVDIKLLGLRCAGDVLLKSPSNDTDIIYEMNHLNTLGAVDKIFKIVNNDITLVRNITASGTISGAFTHVGTAIFNPSATSTESCIVFEIQTETATSPASRPSINCNYDFFVYHTPTGDCAGTIEKVKIDTTDANDTQSLFHGLLEIKDDDITPENIVYSFDANNQSCFLEGQITLKPTIRASPLASDEVVIQNGGVDHVTFNTGDNPTGVDTGNGYSRFKGSVFYPTLNEVGTLSDAVCFGGDFSSLQSSIPIIIKDLDKTDNTGGILFQTVDPSIRGYSSGHTKCFNLDLTSTTNAIPTVATEAHEALTRFQPIDEYVFPDADFPDASHEWYNWEFGGVGEGATQLHSQFYAETGSLQVLNHRVGFSVYIENMLMGDLTGETYNRDLFAFFKWTSSVDSHVTIHTTDTHYLVSGGEFISALDAVHQFGQERRNGTMLTFEDYIAFPSLDYVYKIYPQISNEPLNDVDTGDRAYIQLSAGTTGGGELYPSWWVWAYPVPTNFRNFTGLS